MGAAGKALVCFTPPSVPQVSQLLPFLFLPHTRHSSELWFPQTGKDTCGPGRLTGPGQEEITPCVWRVSGCLRGLEWAPAADLGGPHHNTATLGVKVKHPKWWGRRKHGTTAASVLGYCSVVPRVKNGGLHPGCVGPTRPLQIPRRQRVLPCNPLTRFQPPHLPRGN